MSISVSVQNGTNAGIKGIYNGDAPAWVSSCGSVLKGHWAKCPDCNERRPS